LGFDCVFTSLDYIWIPDSTTTGSRRNIHWIPLSPPSYQSIQRIPFPKTDAIKLLLSEVSKHWRSIVLLHKECDSKKQEFLENYDYLSAQMSGVLSVGYSPLTEAHIVSSFKREEISLESIIEGKRVASWISSGVFINTVGDKSIYIIPEISIFFIRNWATKHQRESLGFLLAQVFQLDSVNSWTCTSYETFHTYWQAIRSYCLVTEDNKRMNIRSFYSNRGVLATNWIERNITVKKEMTVRSCLIQQIKTVEFNYVYLLGKSNAGFDSITFFDGGNGEVIAVAIENRFSDPNSTTILNPADLQRKYTLTHENIRENLPVIESKNIYLVFCYWRNMPKYLEHTDKSEKLPRNTLLLRRDDLEFLYGPLSRRPYLGFKQESDE